MNIKAIIGKLKEIEKITNEDWINSLDDLKLKELGFHDWDRDNKFIEALDQDTYDKFYSNKKFYRTVVKSSEYTKNWIIEHANNTVFLDYACGNGGNALKAAQAGAKLSIGLDISAISIQNAKNQATSMGYDNTFFIQADAENTKLPDGCIDTIICSGMLHHLDLSYAFPELRRILSPNGIILAIEALNYNPIIKLYRYFTPIMRTEWEKSHILNLKDIEFAKHFFDIGEIKYWHITNYGAAFIPKLLPLLNFVDEIFTKIPMIRKMAWMFSFELLSKN